MKSSVHFLSHIHIICSIGEITTTPTISQLQVIIINNYYFFVIIILLLCLSYCKREDNSVSTSVTFDYVTSHLKQEYKSRQRSYSGPYTVIILSFVSLFIW